MGPCYATLTSVAIIMCNAVLSCKTSQPKGLDCCRWSDFGIWASLFTPNGGTAHSCSCQQSGADPKWWIVHIWGLPFIIVILQHIAAGCAHKKRNSINCLIYTAFGLKMWTSAPCLVRGSALNVSGVCVSIFACSVKESGKAWDSQDVVRK